MIMIVIGVSACCYGEEEENATEMPRYGVVDEKETTAIAS